MKRHTISTRQLQSDIASKRESDARLRWAQTFGVSQHASGTIDRNPHGQPGEGPAPREDRVA